MRELGTATNSEGTMRRVRTRMLPDSALDVSHFRGERTWADAQLRHAVAERDAVGRGIDILGCRR